jgi:mRNA interferase MazF
MGRRVVTRGDIYLCDFGTPIGHEPGFRRPAVVVSRSELSRHGVPILVPVTRTRRGYPTHVELSDVLPVVSYVQCELIRAVSSDRLIRPVASLDPTHLAKIEAILRRILDL